MFALRATRLVTVTALLALVALTGAPTALAWMWPVDGEVLREYSLGDDEYAPGQHRGIDVAVGGAHLVLAPVTGEVTFAGQVPTHGLTVTISTPDGYKASLTHLGALSVKRGAHVEEGDPVAQPGPSGEAEHAVPYVHLGVRLGADDKYVDPAKLLPPRSAPVPPPAPSPAPSPAPVPTPPPSPSPAPPPVASPVPTPPPTEASPAPVAPAPAPEVAPAPSVPPIAESGVPETGLIVRRRTQRSRSRVTRTRSGRQVRLPRPMPQRLRTVRDRRASLPRRCNRVPRTGAPRLPPMSRGHAVPRARGARQPAMRWPFALFATRCHVTTPRSGKRPTRARPRALESAGRGSGSNPGSSSWDSSRRLVCSGSEPPSSPPGAVEKRIGHYL